MKVKTDLSAIKALAQAFLMMNIEATPHSPIIVTHPFTDTGYVVLAEDKLPQNILENRDTLIRWQAEKKKQLNKSDSADQIFSLLTKLYRMVFLKYSEPYLSKKDFSRILADVRISAQTS